MAAPLTISSRDDGTPDQIRTAKPLLPTRGEGRRTLERLPNGPFPMWMFLRIGGAIVAANDAAIRTFGYARDELLARTVRDLCPARALETAPKCDLSPWTGTFDLVRKDGSAFMADVALIDADASATMVIAYRAFT